MTELGKTNKEIAADNLRAQFRSLDGLADWIESHANSLNCLDDDSANVAIAGLTQAKLLEAVAILRNK